MERWLHDGSQVVGQHQSTLISASAHWPPCLDGCNMSISSMEVEMLRFHVEMAVYKVVAFCVKQNTQWCAIDLYVVECSSAWFEPTCSQIEAEIDPDAFTPRQFTFLTSNLCEIIKSIWNIHAPSGRIHKIYFVSFTVHNAGHIVGSLEGGYFALYCCVHKVNFGSQRELSVCEFSTYND